MGSDNKTYRFEAESNFEEVFSRIRQSAQELGRDILSEGREMTNTSRELLTYYESQIDAIEKQNKLFIQQRELAAQGRLNAVLQNTTDAGALAEARKTYSKESADIRLEKKEESIFIDTLKELIDTIKEEAREERVAERDNTEDLINSLDDRRDEIEIADATEASRSQSSSDGDKTDEEKEDNSSKGTNYSRLSQISSQKNELGVISVLAGSAAGSFLGAAGGGFVSNLLNRFFGGGEELEGQLGKMEAVTGIRDIISILGPSKFGYDNLQALQLQSNVAKAMKSSDRSAGSAMDIMAAVRGYDIEEGDLVSMIKAGRRDGSPTSIAQSVVGLDKLLMSTGAVGSRDKALFPEYIDILRQLIETQSRTLEKTSTTTSMQVIQAFSNMKGSFGDPATMSERISTINQSLTSPGNDFKSAMSFSILRQLNPNASFTDLMKMRENGINQPGYLSRYMDILNQQSGGNREMLELLANSYLLGGNQFQQAESLVSSYLDPKTRELIGGIGTKSNIPTTGQAESQLRDRGQTITGDILEDTAIVRNTITKLGNESVNAITDFINSIQRASSALGKFGSIFSNDSD